MSAFRSIALAIALGLSPAAAMAAPVVQNAGFEIQAPGSNTWDAADWDGESAQSTMAQRFLGGNGGGWAMRFGAFEGHDEITQAAIGGITTDPETVYELSFFYKGIGKLTAKLDSDQNTRPRGTDTSTSFKLDEESSVWLTGTMRFLADSGKYTLIFSGNGKRNKGDMWLDDVSIKECSASGGVQSYSGSGSSNYDSYTCGGSGNVPLPATLPLLGLGFLGLGLARRKLAA